MPHQAMKKVAAAAPPALADLQVLVTSAKASIDAISYADSVACDHGAHVGVVVFNELPLFPAGYGDSTAYARVWEDALEGARKDGDALEARARASGERLSSPVSYMRTDQSSEAAAAFVSTRARLSDATIIGVAKGSDDGVERSLISALLFDSGRPLILVPEGCSRGPAPRRVLIAWQPTREATRAVHDAMPLLQRASEVRLAMIDDGRATRGDGSNPGSDMAQHLARHGVNVELRVVPQGGQAIAQTLLDEARYFGADLIVMGGYGHSKLREWIFGGATRDMLRNATTPIFIAH